MFKYPNEDELMPPSYTVEVHRKGDEFEAFSKNVPEEPPSKGATEAIAYSTHLQKLHKRYFAEHK